MFDEIEKAHPDVFNLLLQVLDDGRLTDNRGRVVDFTNTILIMTSNIGSRYLLEGIDESGEISKEAEDQVNEALKASFRPEFLNRIDDIVMFKPLTRDNMKAIIDLELASINSRLKDRNITLEITDACEDFIIESAYDLSLIHI